MIKVRHQHYQGEPHPASRKVSITFKASALPPLETEAQQHKFKLLCGPRWNALTDEVKISCELFPTPEMNEKWCSDALDRLIKEAQVRSAFQSQLLQLVLMHTFAGFDRRHDRYPARHTASSRQTAQISL